MTKEMTKQEMAELIESLKKDNEELKASTGISVKTKVMDLITNGVNTIEDISTKLNISSKNVSSNLTYLRNDLKSNNETIISQRIDGKTYLKVMNFIDLGWNF